MDDRISKLPTDILTSIISRLSLREAIATCILSTSWRHLSSYVTYLNFPPYISFNGTLESYVSMVNQVLNSHRGGRIKEFRLDLSDRAGEFASSFEFAVAKKAEIVHISIAPKKIHHSLPSMNGLECLKELSLSHICLDDQDFGHLVSNCAALECFTIEYVAWRNVSIVGLSKLKHINLFHLWQTESVVIRDLISLVSLTFFEWRCVWKNEFSAQLSNIPKLTKLQLRGDYNQSRHIEFLAEMTSCIRNQLQLLLISSRTFSSLNHDLLFQLANIKHLEFVFYISGHWRHISSHVIHLVKACGSLEKLLIKFGVVIPETETREHPRSNMSPKHIEISGYLGYCDERGLILDLINNITSLQKVIFVANREEALDRARLDFRHITSVGFLVIS
ncbi:putative FBD-associated F-box protein [Salvia divinorum]|uniref:FBD-associated F-box protein n=1 Tax=Salvia divinorum TaxID=28513 RepID=A0ABD1GU29_SALDI